MPVSGRAREEEQEDPSSKKSDCSLNEKRLRKESRESEPQKPDNGKKYGAAKALCKLLKPDEGVALIGACVAAWYAPKELTGLWWAVSSVATGIAAGYGSRWGGVGGNIILGEMGAFAGLVLGGWMAYDAVKADVDAWAISKQKPKVKIEEKIKQIPSVSLMLSKHDRAPERAALIQKKTDRSFEL